MATARLAGVIAALLACAARADDVYLFETVDLGVYPKAQCLDGTPAGFYWSGGSGGGATKFVSHLQGGAWCGGVADCAGRAKGALGSSSEAFWPRNVSCPPGSSGAPWVCSFDGGNGGLFSTNATINPLLYNANKVYFIYCDGASFAGMVDAPIDAGNGQTIYARGRYILDALFGTLAARHGLAGATDYVSSGNSAGGLATYLHADYISDLVRAVAPAAKVVAVPDSGFFMDVPSYSGNRALWQSFNSTFAFHNATGPGSTNQACLSAKAPSDRWQCVMAPYLLPFIRTPMFVSQSFADSWQSGAVMGLPCLPGACSDNATEAAVVAYMADFRAQMVAQLAPVIYSSGTHGGFISSCYRHGTVAYNGAFSQWLVQNQTQAATFGEWYTGLGPRSWLPASGFLAEGGDVLPAQNMSVDDARALCAATAGCAGITFEASAAEPSGSVNAFFKGTSLVTAGSGWWTWLLQGPATAVVDGQYGSNPTCVYYA